MYRMVKNKSINHLRHQEVENKYLSYAMLRNDQYDDYYKDYDSLLEKIRKAIEELPPQGKAVFKKCFIENLSYKEVAEELGVSVNTVKTHVSKSLKRLREDFSGDILLLFLQFSKK